MDYRDEGGAHEARGAVACSSPDAATKQQNSPGGQNGPGGRWQKLSLPASATGVDNFDIKPNGDMFGTDRTTGVWKTTNNGQSWQQINTGLPNLFGWTIQVNPHTLDLILNVAGNPTHFYVSHDENSWSQIPEPSGFSLTAKGAFSGALMPRVAES